MSFFIRQPLTLAVFFALIQDDQVRCMVLGYIWLSRQKNHFKLISWSKYFRAVTSTFEQIFAQCTSIRAKAITITSSLKVRLTSVSNNNNAESVKQVRVGIQDKKIAFADCQFACAQEAAEGLQ